MALNLAQVLDLQACPNLSLHFKPRPHYGAERAHRMMILIYPLDLSGDTFILSLIHFSLYLLPRLHILTYGL